MEDFELQLKIGFLEEATQLLTDAERCFLDLETSPDNPAVIDQLFRLAHSLKGSGKAVGFTELGDFTHKLESLLLKIKNKEILIGQELVGLLLACNDHLHAWVQKLKGDMSASMDSGQLLASIEAQLAGRSIAPVPESTGFVLFDEEVKVEENSPSQQSASILSFEAASTREQATEPTLKSPPIPKPAANADDTVRVKLNRLEQLLNFVGEMVILQSVLKEQSQSLGSIPLRKVVHQLGKVTKEVQDISMSLRMVPLKQTFQKMQRIVRDTSLALNKKIEFVVEGENTEVDKTVLESISDPLVHLIRNSVDHGVESAEDRLAQGKPELGVVTLKAYHQGGNLVLEIRDDGKGLDPKKLRSKAIEKGIIAPHKQLSDSEAYQLIFAPGFSTKTEVTDVSGRGVGMDVVRTNILALQGEIMIETEVGKGTCFKIQLPLTLSIIDGMIVRCSGERYVIPLAQVLETLRPSPADVHFASGVGELLSLRGETFPIFQLNDLLGFGKVDKPVRDYTAVIVNGQDQNFVVLVDEIISQAQVVIKQLGAEHKGQKGLSASAILGDGRPALILELEELSRRHTSLRPSVRRVS